MKCFGRRIVPNIRQLLDHRHSPIDISCIPIFRTFVHGRIQVAVAKYIEGVSETCQIIRRITTTYLNVTMVWPRLIGCNVLTVS